ncbi:hypothetical protein ANOM_002494 [Aspergillus nomiae NRRL 13137]|uniref:Benzoate 4-monooxygenase cytochrome P450 n=1 Tax=Aspergillus nomiae NRRL (strain ATCC 15546 / NRRL 13137 / CBS 260.88 / M93) TaxID=1509407 RepID=A0A0L1J920_ASPN3|nr:uncharacterized protein ANOM_002494 [Aspergillus nomiae NRRL 13137]KNG88301.1 hypothetical protein ANOM_002494 [Aspergillus nomiae NRRL 13137]
MAIVTEITNASPTTVLMGLAAALICTYIIYWRYLHPLSMYPGPFLASLTDLWQVNQFLTLQQPYHLTELHDKYGPVVRYGPDKISITEESAIQAIYQKGSRLMPKTEFYDAYGAAEPNVFGMRNEAIHSIRRRHMSHSFSLSYVKEMEPYLDLNIQILKEKIRRHCHQGDVFDLKKALHHYVVDTLGELAFSQSFGVQEADNESLVPGAKDPDTGARLTQTDLETEAFGFIIAGTHTTSATTSLLFYHLLHNPAFLEELVKEIDGNLPRLDEGTAAYSIADAETSLPFLRNCMRENFRITPVFTMPLARHVIAPEGVLIAGHHLPQGTSVAVCNHAFHHNPSVWGEDHNQFDPHRWDKDDVAAKARYLMHFGLGGRQCIGKTVATANIYKLMSTLLAEFKFELANEQERADARNGLYSGKIPELISVGISDLKEPLLVRASLRAAK